MRVLQNKIERLQNENKENIIINKDRKFGLSLNEMLEGRNIYSASISPSGKYILIKYFDLNEKGKRNYGNAKRKSS